MSQDNARGRSAEGLNLLTNGAASDRPLDGLTAAQRDAATHTDARAVVLGAAGTGKTRVVEARFRWLVSEGCDP
ncbi:MAG: UvrD-helicase domain-containing protein, partial [Solirubrobacteraceae bacterium]